MRQGLKRYPAAGGFILMNGDVATCLYEFFIPPVRSLSGKPGFYALECNIQGQSPFHNMWHYLPGFARKRPPNT